MEKQVIKHWRRLLTEGILRAVHGTLQIKPVKEMEEIMVGEFSWGYELVPPMAERRWTSDSLELGTGPEGHNQGQTWRAEYCEQVLAQCSPTGRHFSGRSSCSYPCEPCKPKSPENGRKCIDWSHWPWREHRQTRVWHIHLRVCYDPWGTYAGFEERSGKRTHSLF